MEKYYIGFYTSDGTDRIKGQWKLTDAEVQQEADSYLYKNKLKYSLIEKASIDKSEVEKIAKENNLSIAEILSCI